MHLWSVWDIPLPGPVCPGPGHPLRPPGPLRKGSIVVDYLVLLELSFSLQLESQYEKVKTDLKEALQNVTENGDSCQHNQSERRLGRGVRAAIPACSSSVWGLLGFRGSPTVPLAGTQVYTQLGQGGLRGVPPGLGCWEETPGRYGQCFWDGWIPDYSGGRKEAAAAFPSCPSTSGDYRESPLCPAVPAWSVSSEPVFPQPCASSPTPSK